MSWDESAISMNFQTAELRPKVHIDKTPMLDGCRPHRSLCRCASVYDSNYLSIHQQSEKKYQKDNEWESINCDTSH